MTIKARCKWTEGFQFVASSESGHALVMDSRFGDGKDSAPPPMEVTLMGLLGCTGMDVAFIMKKKRINLTTFEVSAEAESADKHPKIYTSINIHYRVAGEGVTPLALEQAINLSQEKYCSVTAMLAKVVKITTSYEIVDG